MRKPSIVVVIVAIVVSLVVLWVARSTEWGEVEIPAPLRGDAATNPFYAAQQLLEALGATSERRESLGATSNAALVVLSTWGWDINSARRTELERWVEGGGRLVVDAALITGSDAFEKWSGIARERDEQGPDEDLLQAPEAVEPCETVAEIRAGRVATGESFEVCSFDQASWLEVGDDLSWGLEDGESYLVAARVSLGRGSVTVVNGVPFVYRELFEGEHGELLAAATNFRAGDHVVFMSEADVSSLLELVWRHGAPVVVVLMLFIALALWRGAVRFGPFVAPAERVRRSLAEQILGTGRFALRVGGGAALVAAERRALHEAAARRIVGFENLPSAEQAAAVARLASLDVAELGAAMNAAPEPRSPELRTKLALLESARRKLISGNQWSKHAKRI
jgi:hypothetical protein